MAVLLVGAPRGLAATGVNGQGGARELPAAGVTGRGGAPSIGSGSSAGSADTEKCSSK
jgi:hypothetical protein